VQQKRYRYTNKERKKERSDSSELVVGLVGALGVVFATFPEDVGAGAGWCFVALLG
jgi:hypothetical protein